MPTRALSGARMVRDLGVTNEFLAANVASANKIQQVASDQFISRGLANTSTGNVQGEQPWYDVQVPDWTTGAHVTNWTTLQRYLSSVAMTNSLVPASATFSGIGPVLDGTTYNTFANFVLAPNGKLYGIPDYSTRAIVLDPVNDTLTTFGSFPGNTFGGGGGTLGSGCLAVNGLIYASPLRATQAIIIDPANNTVTKFGSFPNGSLPYSTGGLQFIDTISAPNGLIYFVPYASTQAVVVDPRTNGGTLATFFGNFEGYSGFNSGGYTGGTVAPNGKIYMVPFASSRIAIIDPYSPGGTSVQFINTSFSYNTYQRSVLAPNGKIYMIPNQSSIGAIIDPNNNTITTYNFPDGLQLTNGVLAPNGKIYCSSGYSFAAIIDPENNTVTSLLIRGAGSTSNVAGMTVTPNGKIYFTTGIFGINIPYFTLLNNNNWNINVCTNPFFSNK